MIAALLDPSHKRLFDVAVDKALGGEGGDAGAQNYIRTCPASHGDRLVLQLAFALWRGYGPAIAVDELWGMDGAVAERILLGMAMAIRGADAPELLQSAAALYADRVASEQAPDDEE